MAFERFKRRSRLGEFQWKEFVDSSTVISRLSTRLVFRILCHMLSVNRLITPSRLFLDFAACQKVFDTAFRSSRLTEIYICAQCEIILLYCRSSNVFSLFIYAFVSPSKKHSLVIGLVRIVVAVFTFAAQTFPSFPMKTLVILPNGHFPQWMLSSYLIKAFSSLPPTLRIPTSSKKGS